MSPGPNVGNFSLKTESIVCISDDRIWTALMLNAALGYMFRTEGSERKGPVESIQQINTSNIKI